MAQVKVVLTAPAKRVPSVQRLIENYPGLTMRQKEVLVLAAQGKGDKEIAHTLKIDETTTKHHIENIRKRMHTTNRVHSVAMVVEVMLRGGNGKTKAVRSIAPSRP